MTKPPLPQTANKASTVQTRFFLTIFPDDLIKIKQSDLLEYQTKNMQITFFYDWF